MIQKRSSFFANLAWIATLCVASPAWAQVSLGAAQGFAVLAGTTVTNTGPSNVVGSLGVSPGSAVTGFPPGNLTSGSIHSADTAASQAQTDIANAYTMLVLQPVTKNLTGQDLGTLVLTPGVYAFASSASLTGTVVLDGQGDPNAIFTFQIGSALTAAVGSSVVAINGAQNCNVFWQIGSSATLGTNSRFIGNILANTSVTLNTGASVSGRVLASHGAVTLDSNAVTVPNCKASTPDLTPTIGLLSSALRGISGIGTLPPIADLRTGDGPAFAAALVSVLSKFTAQPLVYAGQNANGTVTVSGFNGSKLAFIPHSYQQTLSKGDSRANGLYPLGNGQYQAVVDGQLIVLAPALIALDQLVALLPGVRASVADNGNISASLNGVNYVVQPGVIVTQVAATGSAQLLAGSNGLFSFIDAQGNQQTLYPAFSEPARLRAILQGMDGSATLSVQLDGTAAIVLNGQRYTLVPDITLGTVAADRAGQPWWQESATRYRVLNLQTSGTTQGLTVKP